MTLPDEGLCFQIHRIIGASPLGLERLLDELLGKNASGLDLKIGNRCTVAVIFFFFIARKHFAFSDIVQQILSF